MQVTKLFQVHSICKVSHVNSKSTPVVRWNPYPFRLLLQQLILIPHQLWLPILSATMVLLLQQQLLGVVALQHWIIEVIHLKRLPMEVYW